MPTLFRTGRMTRAWSFAPVVLCLALLSGCTPTPPAATPTAVPTVAPVFASEEEALAAAVVAYEGYLAASDAVGHDAGAAPERIADWVTEDWMPREMASYKSLAATGNKLSGKSTFRLFELQRLDQDSSGRLEMSVYVCADVSMSRVLNGEGSDITPDSRADIVPLELSLESAPTDSQVLLIAGSTPWSGQNFC